METAQANQNTKHEEQQTNNKGRYKRGPNQSTTRNNKALTATHNVVVSTLRRQGGETQDAGRPAHTNRNQEQHQPKRTHKLQGNTSESANQNKNGTKPHGANGKNKIQIMSQSVRHPYTNILYYLSLLAFGKRHIT